MPETANRLPGYVKYSAYGVIAGAASGGIFSAVSSLIAYSAADPNSLIDPLATASFFISSAICGIFSGKKSGKNPIVALISGAVFALLLTVISFAIPGSNADIEEWTLMRLGGIATAFMGGLLVSINRKSKKARRRHTHKKSICRK